VCAAFSLHIKYVVHIAYYSFLPSILLFGHFLLELSVGSWLIGVDSAGYGLLCVLVLSMLMNIVPTTTTLSCASATTGPCCFCTATAPQRSQTGSLYHCAIDSTFRLQHSACTKGCVNVVASVLSYSSCSMWNSAHAANRPRQLCCGAGPNWWLTSSAGQEVEHHQ